ncbi:glycogen synthase GlgA [Paenibacillus sp. GCM10023252]|uniref:glycogen synthase GlgA n=1 Tax=Paenibacillus sp. GCM10023252 TaxID=3252649 RepID=UPI003612CB09
MKVLQVAAEGSPFLKTGGLADVIGALPKALKESGVDVRVIMPRYKNIPETYRNRMEYLGNIEVPLAWRRVYCGLFKLVYDGVVFYFIDNEYYFGARDGAYGYYDDGERFAYFNRAVLQALPELEFQPDIIHSHDWHAAMIAVLMQKHYLHDLFYTSIRTVYTIHNLQFQGIYPYGVFNELLGLTHDYFQYDRVEHEGCVNFMKGGINYSDIVTTVSRTYADEIRTPHFGEGLDGALRWAGGRLRGIVNGIDDQLYDPRSDAKLFQMYSEEDAIQGKAANKKELQRLVGLDVNESVPLIGMVGRLTDQKGLDLVAHVLHEVMEADDVQLVVLGTGDDRYEQMFRDYAARYPGKLAVQTKFDDGLARQIYAASDLFLMPSRFEPCGLSQLLALRYGSIPIVRETGGLNDTVQAYNEFTGEGNGFSFTNYNAHDMLYTIRRAIAFYTRSDDWQRLVRTAMSGDYSWTESARQYREIYEELIERRIQQLEAQAADAEAAAADNRLIADNDVVEQSIARSDLSEDSQRARPTAGLSPQVL